MSCPQNIDWKAYALGELPADAKRSAAAHLNSCDACQDEFSGVQATLATLSALREEEVPRRIAFVSDKVFEPRWWQRMFTPTFASACVLAGAIVFHAASNKGPDAAAIQAQIDNAVNQRVEMMQVRMDQDKREMRAALVQSVGLVTTSKN
jgi:anti-sigma factor RsiW